MVLERARINHPQQPGLRPHPGPVCSKGRVGTESRDPSSGSEPERWAGAENASSHLHTHRDNTSYTHITHLTPPCASPGTAPEPPSHPGNVTAPLAWLGGRAGVQEGKDSTSLAPLCNTSRLGDKAFDFFSSFPRETPLPGCQSFPGTPRDASRGFQSNLSEPSCFCRLECVSGLGDPPRRGRTNQQHLPARPRVAHSARTSSGEEPASGTLGLWGKLECGGAGRRLCPS